MPRLSTLTAIKNNCGLFLLHYPWSRLHKPLACALPYGARTFLTRYARNHQLSSSSPIPTLVRFRVSRESLTRFGSAPLSRVTNFFAYHKSRMRLLLIAANLFLLPKNASVFGSPVCASLALFENLRAAGSSASPGGEVDFRQRRKDGEGCLYVVPLNIVISD